MLAEIAAKLRKAAGLPASPTGVVANGSANGRANGASKSSSRAKAPKRKVAAARK